MTAISQREVEQRLGLGVVDEEELGRVLLDVVQRATYPSDVRADYPSVEAPALSLLYRKDGSLAAILPGKALTSDLLNKVAEAVATKLLVPPKRMVCRLPVFAHLPTEGYWRYKDELVIRRAPDRAPRPIALMAPHPLILEVAFMGADDWSIGEMRARREPRRLALLLSLLIRGLKLPHAVHRNTWAVELDFARPLEGSILTRDIYHIPDFAQFAEELSEQGDLPDIELVESVPWAIDIGRVLALPATLPGCLAAYKELRDLEQRKLLRAAYWLHHAGEVFHLSKSASYQALVQAVECLIDAPRGHGACAECGRPTAPGPTRLFTDFIEQHAPMEDTSEQAARKILYKTRSALAHGNELFYVDEESGYGWHGPRAAFERHVAEQAHDICRRAVVGWLGTKAVTPRHDAGG
jgi:hypothetical protein